MLTRKDHELLYGIVNECAVIGVRAQLEELIRHTLRQLIPYEMAACGMCELASVRPFGFVNFDFPIDYLRCVLLANQRLESPLLDTWRRHAAPCYANSRALAALAEKDPCETSMRWLEALQRNGIRNLCVHGVRIDGKAPSSYFAFGNLQHPLSRREEYLLSLVVPHLHMALLRTRDDLARSVSANEPIDITSRLPAGRARRPAHTGQSDIKWRLSAREMEVLQWVYYGKTNAEVASLLSISEFTVKNHIKNILEKLPAMNRTHALAKAIEGGLISADNEPTVVARNSY